MAITKSDIGKVVYTTESETLVQFNNSVELENMLVENEDGNSIRLIEISPWNVYFTTDDISQDMQDFIHNNLGKEKI